MPRKNLIILFISLVVVYLGYGIAMPVIPFYVESFGGGGRQLGLLIASFGIMQLIFAPVWGSLTDKYGRKPIMLIGLGGLCFSLIFFGLASRLWMLYAAQLISGSLASAMLPAAMAYASDNSSEEERGGEMGRIGGAVGIGSILGPGLGGVLAGGSLSAPFFFAAAFCGLTFFIILLGLPESLARSDRSQEIEIKIFQFSGLIGALSTAAGFGLITAFLAIYGQTIFSGVYGLYALEKFGYGPEQVGAILMAMGFMYALAQGVFIGPLTKKFGENKVIKVSLLGNALGFVLILIASSFFSLLLTMSLFILFNSFLKPAAVSHVSQNAGKTKQGAAMGIVESYMSLGRILGPLWGGFIFDLNLNLPFASGVIIFAAAFIWNSFLVKSF